MGWGTGDPRDGESAPDAGEDSPQSGALQNSRSSQVQTRWHVSPAGATSRRSTSLQGQALQGLGSTEHLLSVPRTEAHPCWGRQQCQSPVEGQVFKGLTGPAILSLMAVPCELRWSCLLPPGLPRLIC